VDFRKNEGETKKVFFSLSFKNLNFKKQMPDAHQMKLLKIFSNFVFVLHNLTYLG